jgi:GSH-dependent disulfide-bond oxidoreductase
MNSPIELYGAITGNCLRAAIALEEAGIPYTPRHIDLSRGEQREPDYLAINPAGKVPALIDHSVEPALVLTQSNAIILYAAMKAPGTLCPNEEGAERARTYDRFLFFITDVIAPSHAAFFLRSAGLGEHAAPLDERALATLATADSFVTHSRFMAGAQFSMADISAFSMARFLEHQLNWEQLPNLLRWYNEMKNRPAVQRGLCAFD